MRTLFAGLIVLASATVALGDTVRLPDKDGSWWEGVIPPARYIGPYTGELRMHALPRAEAQAICEQKTGKAGQFGCVDLWPRACDVYIVDDLPKALRAYIESHELAHCRGWPADHPLN